MDAEEYREPGNADRNPSALISVHQAQWRSALVW